MQGAIPEKVPGTLSIRRFEKDLELLKEVG
jgi:hypothetical protein